MAYELLEADRRTDHCCGGKGATLAVKAYRFSNVPSIGPWWRPRAKLKNTGEKGKNSGVAEFPAKAVSSIISYRT
jgi:hypothetical protein